MSENKHTPEPWAVDPDSTDEISGIVGPDGNKSIILGDYSDWWVTKADARRIVACVNACAGIDTEFLEVAPIGIFASKYGSPGYIDQLEKQRDELLAALEGLVNALDSCIDLTPERIRATIATIASVKGEQ